MVGLERLGRLALPLQPQLGVAEQTHEPDRRVGGTDRRRHPRSGRRRSDPHTHWRRIAWLFVVYAAYLSVRSLPSAVKRLFRKRTAT